MPFRFKRLNLPEVILIEPDILSDERGLFIESYKFTDFSQFGIKEEFLQDNYSLSISKGIVRGLHYQKKAKAQAKLMKVINGAVFDVAVDIRKNSPTYGKWVSAILSAENRLMLYIPGGFAHGFCTLEDNTEIIYKCSTEYSFEHGRGIVWNDRDINITWPVDNPILSLKDRGFPCLKEADNDFVYE